MGFGSKGLFDFVKFLSRFYKKIIYFKCRKDRMNGRRRRKLDPIMDVRGKGTEIQLRFNIF